MENKDRSVLIMGIIVSLFGVLVSLMYFNDKPNVVIATNICKDDSLQKVINQLQVDIETAEDGWGNKNILQSLYYGCGNQINE
jgi:hypothetical protein